MTLRRLGAGLILLRPRPSLPAPRQPVVVSHLRVVLLCTLLVLLLPVWPAAAAAWWPAASAAPDGPSIGADREPVSSDLRASERVELTVGAVRLTPGDVPDAPLVPRVARVPVATRAAGGATWCGLVHCRRLAGALLLRYATPPPARA